MLRRSLISLMVAAPAATTIYLFARGTIARSASSANTMAVNRLTAA